MVYLKRTMKIIGNWDKMDAVTKTFADSWKKHPEVKSLEFWGNISGPQDETHLVVGFESLAAEEAFVMKLYADKGFEKVMSEFMTVFTIGSDQLYRSW